jgi:hypothetical protein
VTVSVTTELHAIGPTASLDSGELRGTDDAVTLDLGTAGHTDRWSVRDGSFLTAPQSLGGYTVIEASSPKEAVELLKGWPTGGVFEIRPLVER